MSVCATIATWKLTKNQVTPTQKLILLSYADRVGESFECWPSNRRLELDTGLDRHTICENKQELLKKGLIVYTGEKRGKTKSVDVIRLTYVQPREGYQDESSVEMPIASKSSSGQMPIGKQWANAHTEPTMLEPPIVVCGESSTTQHSQKEKTEREALENQKNIELFNKKFSERDVTIEEIFKGCQAFNAPKNRWVDSQLFNKWLLMEKPDNYPKKGSHASLKKQSGMSDQVKYSNFIGDLKAEIMHGLKPKDTVIPSFEVWISQHA